MLPESTSILNTEIINTWLSKHVCSRIFRQSLSKYTWHRLESSLALKINNFNRNIPGGNKCKHQGSLRVKSIIKLMKNLSAIIAPRVSDSFANFCQTFASKQIYFCVSQLIYWFFDYHSRHEKNSNWKINEFFGFYVSSKVNIPATEC